MATNKNLLITEDLINHLKAAFPLVPYAPGSTLESIAFNQGTQEPIIRLERLLKQRNERGR